MKEIREQEGRKFTAALATGGAIYVACEEKQLKTIVRIMQWNNMKDFWKCFTLLFFHVTAVDGKVM